MVADPDGEDQRTETVRQKLPRKLLKKGGSEWAKDDPYRFRDDRWVGGSSVGEFVVSGGRGGVFVLTSRVNHPVTYPADRLDDMSVFAKFLSETTYVGIDSPRFRGSLIIPDA